METEAKLKAKGLDNRHDALCRAAGFAFYNTSPVTFDTLLDDDANLSRRLKSYINGFSENVREIFHRFRFDDAIRILDEVGRLYLVLTRFNEKSRINLAPKTAEDPDGLDNHEMGTLFEQLIRRFNEDIKVGGGSRRRHRRGEVGLLRPLRRGPPAHLRRPTPVPPTHAPPCEQGRAQLPRHRLQRLPALHRRGRVRGVGNPPLDSGKRLARQPHRAARADEKDQGVGKVGYEINFNRHFYTYQPPRPVAEIDRDIRKVEKNILGMLKEVMG